MSDRSAHLDERLTREDFRTLPLDELAARTGLTLPRELSSEQEAYWREKAFEDYALDLENRSEWGNATQATKPPENDPTG